MSSPPSDSDPSDKITGFARLHPEIQRWIWRRGWSELRDIQESAARAILDGSGDLLIAAATASGKTEAAFFPLLTAVAGRAANSGIDLVYISPLRSLINDQFGRLEDICGEMGIHVTRWHGDVSAGPKQALLQEPRGVLLITPESLEALFVLRGPILKTLFPQVAAVVIDEVHSFIGEERGRQLQSLLYRLELVARQRVRRIGLSATLGDMSLAADFLRPGGGPSVQQIISNAVGSEIRLQIRGYVEQSSSESDTMERTERQEIVEHLYKTLYGSENLVFCNARQDVESYADALREMATLRKQANMFFPHHGSLSRDLREDVERLLKDEEKQITVVCTSTLEMGVDIGSVRSVAQIGPPPSVASLRQRLGRSGRRYEPATLRLYVAEREIGPDAPPQDQLHAALIQSIAMVELLLERWCEPPDHGALHLSTLIQQLLSLIAQHGGVQAQQAFRVLCQGGPFREVNAPLFQDLLRCLGEQGVIMQSDDGALFLAPNGERIVEHYTFYAAFSSAEEYRVVAGGSDLGSIPLSNVLAPGMFLIFAGRRWKVEAMDERRRTIDVSPAAGGRVPRFGGSGGQVHERVRQRMRDLYARSDEPIFLDSAARDLLREGRTNFVRLGLGSTQVIASGRHSIVFPWTGDRIQGTLVLMLACRGLAVEADGLAITVRDAEPDRILDHLRDIGESQPPDPVALASFAPMKILEKHDRLLNDDLLCLNYAVRSLNLLDARHAAMTMSARS
ncbi:MAG: DEAD/DEAH box helicase [Vicinamibacteria bacterium]|nr:DEAD/DEAH box helicase [Vicinamibacteria bacterium]